MGERGASGRASGRIWPATTERIRAAAELLARGALVALPTETVYGLGASALDAEAVVEIFEAKGRPRFDPLICHVHDLDAVDEIVAELPEAARILAEAFWPGPLTLVLPKRAVVPDLVTSGEPTVGVRIPRHPVARALLAAHGRPVAAPSANLFGRTSPTRAEHVEAQLGARVAAILDGGPAQVGVESTIVAALPGQPLRLLRPGGVPLEAIEAHVGPVRVPPPRAFPSASPGRAARHYATRTPLELVAPGHRAADPARVGRLALRAAPQGYGAVEVLSPTGDLAEAARNLFSALRRLDASDVERIEAEAVPETGLGRAIMDRLRRAAAR